MDVIDIVMICIMIPGIILTIWAVGRIGSSSISDLKDKSDREKDDRKEIRNYFLKHDDYVLDDKGYMKLVDEKIKDWTPMNAAMKLGIDDPDNTDNLSWKAWCITGTLSRKTKSGIVSAKYELDNAFLLEDKLQLYRVLLPIDSEIAEEKTYSFPKSDIKNITSTHNSEFGMGAENTDVEARVRYLSIELNWGEETFRIPEGVEGDKIVTKLKAWQKA